MWFSCLVWFTLPLQAGPHKGEVKTALDGAHVDVNCESLDDFDEQELITKMQACWFLFCAGTGTGAESLCWYCALLTLIANIVVPDQIMATQIASWLLDGNKFERHVLICKTFLPQAGQECLAQRMRTSDFPSHHPVSDR